MTEHPFADQLAAYFARQRITIDCFNCGKSFVVETAACPHCGKFFDESVCKKTLDMTQERDARLAALAPPPEEAPPPAVPAPMLGDVIGNAAACLQIRTALDANRARQAQGQSTVFPSTLLVGPAGSGKSTLAGVIASECKRKLHEQLGQSLNDPRAMVTALLELKAGDILYIDEAHGLRKTCTETLYMAMQEGVVIPISVRGKPSPRPVRLPPFTLICATTDEYKLTDSFKQRFQYHIHLKRLTVEELSSAIAQRAERAGVKLEAAAARMIAERSHGTPRKAVMLLNRCIDTALAGGSDTIFNLVVESACEMAELDCLGLTAAARSYLRVLVDSVKPVRLNVLASSLALPSRVVEVEIERDLIYLKLISKDANGRRLTEFGRLHLHSFNDSSGAGAS